MESTILEYAEQHIFQPMINQHRQLTKEKILDSAITLKNFDNAQHFINEHIEDHPQLSDAAKLEMSKAYEQKDLQKIKQSFGMLSKKFENFNYEERNKFHKMQDMYGQFNKENTGQISLKPMKDYIPQVNIDKKTTYSPGYQSN